MPEKLDNPFESPASDARHTPFAPLALLGALLLLGSRVVHQVLGTLHVSPVSSVPDHPELYEAAAWLEGPTAAAFVLGAVLLAVVDRAVPLVGAMAAVAAICVLVWAVGVVPPATFPADTLATLGILVAHWAWFSHRGGRWGARLCAAGALGLVAVLIAPSTLSSLMWLDDATFWAIVHSFFAMAIAAWFGGFFVLFVRIWVALGVRVGPPDRPARADP